MIKRILIFVFSLCAVLVLSGTPCFAADTSAEYESEAVEVEKDTSEVGAAENAIGIFVLAGSVVGAMVAVTLMYKKKDEGRYL